jgi:hypothetical protein
LERSEQETIRRAALVKRKGWAFRIGIWALAVTGAVLLLAGLVWPGVIGLLGAAGVRIAWGSWVRKELARIRGHEPLGVRFERWKRGGVRQHNLEARVPSYIAPLQLEGFFVATKVRRIFPLTEFILFALLWREYLVAVTDSNMVILRLKLPAIFRGDIAGVEQICAPHSISVGWNGKRLQVDEDNYFPIPFHKKDAARVMEMLTPTATGSS